MRLLDFQIFNYKPYRSTDSIPLSPGFNVFIGKNNGGKTALLEALSISSFVNKPHRYSGIPEGQAPSPVSRVELRVELTPDDLRRLSFAQQFHFPVHQGYDEKQSLVMLGEFLARPRYLRVVVNGGPNFSPTPYPSHAMFNAPHTNRSATIALAEDRSALRISGVVNSNNDSVYAAVASFVASSIYTFRAERLPKPAQPYSDNAALVPNAENLPTVLNALRFDEVSFQRFNRLVAEIFPSIRRVQTRPRAGTNEIMIFNSDAPETRPDLAMELAESGTGVGQVLAMLYIIVTSKNPRTIIIDEPNTFLHPGAVRTLVKIMRDNPVQHQYIITTHSPDIIRITEAERVYLVERQDEQSRVTATNSGEMRSFRQTLSEVGFRLSDLFGADHVLWVEGATEEECFPKIVRASAIDAPAGLAVVAVRATGDFEGRKAPAVAIWEIYERLTTTGTLMPTTLAISLDTDGRSPTDIEQAEERSNRLIQFLPRRCFENHLIHPDALVALLNTLPALSQNNTTVGVVGGWLKAHGGDLKYGAADAWKGGLQDQEWLERVRGALLLHDLFWAMATQEYRKVEHGAALTEWICARDLSHFAELRFYIVGLLNERA